MCEKPWVTILTPCYNSEAYVERYLNSILKQTYSRIQLVVVNDGSKDRTEEIVKSFAERFEKRGYILTYVFQENKGLGGAINTGLKHIQGKYFTWCDSDNFYTDDYIETKATYFEEHDNCMVLRCDGYIVNEKDINKPIQKMAAGKVYGNEDNLFIRMMMERGFHFGCAMIRTEAFDAVNPGREIYPSREGQNWQILLPIFYRYKAHYIDRPMFYFVYRATSVSNCTKNQDLTKQLKQAQEYEKIIRETLLSIEMPDHEREIYLDMLQSKYGKIRLQLARKHNDKHLAKEEYEKLKAMGTSDATDEENYNRCISRLYNAVYVCFRFMLKCVTVAFLRR